MGLMAIYEPAPQIQLRPQPVDLGETASAVMLAQELADALGASVNETWHSLCSVHDNMLGLLQSPEGWSALAGYIACDLGLDAADYRPKVH